MENEIRVTQGKSLLVAGLFVMFGSAISFFFTVSTDYMIISWTGLLLGLVVENAGFYQIGKYQSDKNDKHRWGIVLLVAGGIMMVIAMGFLVKVVWAYGI